ncbi:MAG: ATP-dependent metallopeptidase FtsH/Yme1/Tma family protein, partial [Shewanella sp.]|nr:ATP-dependent metallopeptidase FtsH/Yme1/Tma family protein [Shewanella sp.]
MAKNLMVWLVIAIVLMTMFNSFSRNDRTDGQLSYTEFVQQVKQGQISQAIFDNSGNIVGKRTDGSTFKLPIPMGRDPKLLDDLINNNVDTRGTEFDTGVSWADILISWFPMLL